MSRRSSPSIVFSCQERPPQFPFPAKDITHANQLVNMTSSIELKNHATEEPAEPLSKTEWLKPVLPDMQISLYPAASVPTISMWQQHFPLMFCETYVSKDKWFLDGSFAWVGEANIVTSYVFLFSSSKKFKTSMSALPVQFPSSHNWLPDTLLWRSSNIL